MPTVSSVSVDQNTGALLGAQLNGIFTVSAPQTLGVLMSGSFRLSELFTQGLDIAVGGTAYDALNAQTTLDGASWGALRLGLGVHLNNGYPSPTLAVPATLAPAQTLQPVTAVVPEPSTYALIRVGLAGIGAVARRKQITKVGVSAL